MKIVINACFGGFGLSRAATRRYAELKGRPCFIFESLVKGGHRGPLPDDEQAFVWTAFDVPNPNEVLPSFDGWGEMSLEERRAANKAYSDHRIEVSDRSDPDLVRVVEEMGPDASDSLAKLEVVEIPDGVEWEIEEYDGSEWVAEKHRTWGRP